MNSMSEDWIRIIEPEEPRRPSPEEVRRDKKLAEQIAELRQRGRGLVTHFDEVSAPVVRRVVDEGVVSAAASLLEELSAQARGALAKFEEEMDALLASEEQPVTEEVPTVAVPRSTAMTTESTPVSVIRPVVERPLAPYAADIASGVAEHLRLVVDEQDAAADAAGATEDKEGTGLFRLFARLKGSRVSRKTTATMMQLGVLLPTLLFGGVQRTEARETESRSSESATETLPKIDKTYTAEEISANPELAKQIYEKFYSQWKLLQNGVAIPQSNERYVMPPFVLVKYMEPNGSGAHKEYIPHFVAQVVYKDLDKRGKTLSDDLVGGQHILLKTEEDWQRIKILMEQFLDPVAPLLTEEDRSILAAAADRERKIYGDPIPEQDPPVKVADSGRVYERDARSDRQDQRRTTSSHRSTRRSTVGPTGLPRYTIGSGVTRQSEPAHVPDERERAQTTFRLIQATFGPISGTGDDFNPRGRTVELDEHTHDDSAATDEAADVLDFSTREQTTPEERERLRAVTTYFATVFDTDRSLSDRRGALQEILNVHGKPTSDGGREYRLDQFLFSMHGQVLIVDIRLGDETIRSLDLSSAEVWSEFDRQASTM